MLVTRDVLTITGNLAAPGPVAMSLIPSTSAAGRCATLAAPQLVDGHIAPRRLGPTSRNPRSSPIVESVDVSHDEAMLHFVR